MLLFLDSASIGKKVAFICSLFALPLSVAIWLIVAGYSKDVGVAELERAGIAYQRPLVTLVDGLLTYRDGNGLQAERTVDESMQALLRADGQ